MESVYNIFFKWFFWYQASIHHLLVDCWVMVVVATPTTRWLPCRWGAGPSSALQPWRGWYVAVLAVEVLVPLPPGSQHPPFDPWVGLFIGDSSPGPVWAAERVHTPAGHACPRLLCWGGPNPSTRPHCCVSYSQPRSWFPQWCGTRTRVVHLKQRRTYISPYANGVPRRLLLTPYRAESKSY